MTVNRVSYSAITIAVIKTYLWICTDDQLANLVHNQDPKSESQRNTPEHAWYRRGGKDMLETLSIKVDDGNENG
jgi:hypothetical protein